jgi:nucleoside-diphosphate-sugar epimerase
VKIYNLKTVFENMNICLIGGSGFVGTRLIEILKQQGSHTLLNINNTKS